MAMTKCRECGLDVSADAKTCPKCGIERPGKSVSKKRTGRWLTLLAVLGILAVTAGYLVTSIQRDNKIDRLAICARFHGDESSINAEFLRNEIDTLVRSGSSWKEAYGVEAALLGCGTED